MLSPIVEDPDEAHIHPDARAVLVDLAEVVRAIAVITGRPARQALALGDLDNVGADIADHGKELFVFGQYGNERWSSTQRRVVSPRPPAGLATFERDLPALLRRLDAGEAHVEEKGLAVAVHTRRLPDPQDARDRLMEPLRELAEQHDLVLEPGRNVIEVRSPGMTKGQAVRTLVAEQDAHGILFAGDDLGDLDAFEAVAELRDARRADAAGLLAVRGGERPRRARRRHRQGPRGRAGAAAPDHRPRRADRAASPASSMLGPADAS